MAVGTVHVTILYPIPHVLAREDGDGATAAFRPFFSLRRISAAGVFRFREIEGADMIVSTALAITGLCFVRLPEYDRQLSSPNGALTAWP